MIESRDGSLCGGGFIELVLSRLERVTTPWRSYRRCCLCHIWPLVMFLYFLAVGDFVDCDSWCWVLIAFLGFRGVGMWVEND